MESKIKYYNFGKGWGWIHNPEDPEKGIYFHISDVIGELKELFETKKFYDEPISFKTRPSRLKQGHLEAFQINMDLTKRAVGNVAQFENGFGWIKDFHSQEDYFVHFSNLRGSSLKYVSLDAGDPVVFTKSKNDKGKQALDVIKADTRNQLESFSEFDDFNQSLLALESKAEKEHWDYINRPTQQCPVLYSYINYTFERILRQNKLVLGQSTKENKEFAYFNTGLVTPFQDDIYGYFEKIEIVENEGKWKVAQPQYKFLEFETDQSHYRKYFSTSPETATYFAEAEITQLIFDTSLNSGKIIIDKEHILSRKNRFPAEIAQLNDEAFLDAISKSIDLALKRIKRNYKTAIPHFYDTKIQFLLPLCMLSKKDADLALVVNKEESVYKAHTVLSLDQAYNNARLLAKPDREWLNP